MNLRIALYDIGARHALDANAMRRLFALAGLDDEPAAVARRSRLVVAAAAGLLGGFGIICWVAANWTDFGRSCRFILLQTFFVTMCAGALLRPATRTPFAASAMLAIGALLAYFGQTYQTGADPWQLFAWWTALALPLCLGARSDVLWAPWALLAMGTVSLCLRAHTRYSWWWDGAGDFTLIYLAGYSAMASLAAFLSPLATRYTGAGSVALRTSVFLFATVVTLGGVNALFASAVHTHFWLGLVILALAAIPFHARYADLFCYSVLGLSLNVLAVAGLGRALLNGPNSELISALFMLGLAAAALLTATVHLILATARRQRIDQE